MQLDKDDIEILIACVNNAMIKGESAAVVAALLGKLEYMREGRHIPKLNGADKAEETAHA